MSAFAWFWFVTLLVFAAILAVGRHWGMALLEVGLSTNYLPRCKAHQERRP